MEWSSRSTPTSQSTVVGQTRMPSEEATCAVRQRRPSSWSILLSECEQLRPADSARFRIDREEPHVQVALGDHEQLARVDQRSAEEERSRERQVERLAVGLPADGPNLPTGGKVVGRQPIAGPHRPLAFGNIGDRLIARAAGPMHDDRVVFDNEQARAVAREQTEIGVAE